MGHHPGWRPARKGLTNLDCGPPGRGVEGPGEEDCWAAVGFSWPGIVWEKAALTLDSGGCLQLRGQMRDSPI